MNAASVPELIEQYRLLAPDPLGESFFRLEIIDRLGELATREAADFLLHAALNPKEEYLARLEALKVLGRWPLAADIRERLTEAVSRLLAAADRNLRNYAAAAAAGPAVIPERVLPQLLACLERPDESPSVRASALRAIASQGPRPGVVPVLQRLAEAGEQHDELAADAGRLLAVWECVDHDHGS